MGMHIWYRLHLPAPATFEDAIAKITQLREYALTCGFTGARDWPGVGELRMGNADDKYPAVHYVTEELGKGRERHISVPATQWVKFSTMPGDGTESALMGLATYPETYNARTAKQKPQVWQKSTVTFEGKRLFEAVLTASTGGAGWRSRAYARSVGVASVALSEVMLVACRFHGNNSLIRETG